MGQTWNELAREHTRWFACAAAFSVLLLGFPVCAQLPPTGKLSEADEREFRKELQRLEVLLQSANNTPAIELQIAKTYAAGGQYPEALQRLHKLVRANLGFDPSRDPDFARLRNTVEFESIMNDVRRQTPPVHSSRLVATLHAGGVRPENIAFDIREDAFILGSTTSPELVRCSRAGDCIPLVRPNTGEKGYVLGLKVNRVAGVIWAAYNTGQGASIRCYNLETGELLREALIQGKHVFNDLALSLTGTVYVTDTAEGSVYRLPSGATTLQRLAPDFTFTGANGIAISTDEKLLYISTWNDGIDVIELRSGKVAPMIHAASICLAFIDGLYVTQRSLIAIQNGPMLPRIVLFRLGADGMRIDNMKVIERRNSAFDGITTGVITDNKLYYVANPQTDKPDGAALSPLRIFSLPISPQTVPARLTRRRSRQ